MTNLKIFRIVKLPQKVLDEIKGLEILGNITFLPKLSKLGNLKYLWLGNGIKDLGAISDNKELEKLDVSGNPISSIDCMGALVKLKIFNGDDTLITDIKILNRLPELITVNLYGSKLECLPDLSNTNIQTIILSRTPIESLKNIETLKLPFKLWINGCYNLKDITSLLYSNIKLLVYDEEIYRMFKPWLDENLPKIKSKNADFAVFFDWQYEPGL